MTPFLARCGPLSLIGAGFVLTAAGLAIHDVRAAVVGAVTGLVVYGALAAGARFPLVRIVPGLIAMISIGWSNWLLADPRSVEAAVVAAGRIAFFVFPGLILMSFVDPFTLGDHLGQRLRLPARPVLAGVAALQQLDSFADDWDTLERARRARGLGPGAGPVSRARHVASLTLALLVQAVRRAGDMTVAMQARGYSAAVNGGPRRTWAQPAPWRSADGVLIVVTAFVAAVPFIVTATS